MSELNWVIPITNNPNARHFAIDNDVPNTNTENIAVDNIFNCAQIVNSPAPMYIKATNDRIFITP